MTSRVPTPRLLIPTPEWRRLGDVRRCVARARRGLELDRRNSRDRGLQGLYRQFAIGQLMFVPVYPWWAIAMFSLDVLIIYGLAVCAGTRLRVA